MRQRANQFANLRQFLPDGNPVVCLGHRHRDDCAEYDFNSDSWTPIGTTISAGLVSICKTQQDHIHLSIILTGLPEVQTIVNRLA